MTKNKIPLPGGVANRASLATSAGVVNNFHKFTTSILLTLTLTLTACTSPPPTDTATPEPTPQITTTPPTDNTRQIDNITKNPVSLIESDGTFISAMANFSIDLFKRSIEEKENSLISPLSVMLALAMTANGADNETLTQMENVLGGGIPLNELNKYLYSYVHGLPSEEKAKLLIANSIWLRDDEGRLNVEPDFLQTNADYYDTAVFRAAFDEQTVKDINEWVKQNTDGMIEKLLDTIDNAKMLYLINAVMFDAEWENKYDSQFNVREGDFTNINGVKQTAQFMRSREHTYVDDGKAKGVVKPYIGEYSFVAMLPNEGITLASYIESLTGNGFISMLNQAQSSFGDIEAFIPKFEYEYKIEMNDALKELGMPIAFDQTNADFYRMGSSSDGPLYIGDVLHKTYIAVNESGTRAGAVTSVSIEAQSMPPQLRFDRPFIFAIIDDTTNLPIFIGTLVTL